MCITCVHPWALRRVYFAELGRARARGEVRCPSSISQDCVFALVTSRVMAEAGRTCVRSSGRMKLVRSFHSKLTFVSNFSGVTTSGESSIRWPVNLPDLPPRTNCARATTSGLLRWSWSQRMISRRKFLPMSVGSRMVVVSAHSTLSTTFCIMLVFTFHVLPPLMATSSTYASVLVPAPVDWASIPGTPPAMRKLRTSNIKPSSSPLSLKRLTLSS
mmetsp:Transcript_35187/g.70169  ORF Transcript_35187/g.70169 Transcript_35187/m.70169 type:complete len:216 (-) Transcript_35187:320-967(-)